MTAKNKRRGNDFEREVVKLAEAFGLTAARAWGSDGRAMGEAADVDVKIETLKFQCKRRKRLPAYLIPSDQVTGVLTRQDGDRTAYALIRLADLLTLIQGLAIFGFTLDELLAIEEET